MHFLKTIYDMQVTFKKRTDQEDFRKLMTLCVPLLMLWRNSFSSTHGLQSDNYPIIALYLFMP